MCICRPMIYRRGRKLLAIMLLLATASCAPHVVQMQPSAGTPGTLVSLHMEYLVGWPRVEIAGHVMEWSELKLLGAKPESEEIRGEDLTWIEDKILQFRIPSLPPGDYTVTVHDDKGPPREPVYSALETTAYIAFPPVWPFLFRSNQAQATLKILPPLASSTER
ncbi:MAG: hypothetical protein ACM3TN_25865 [Alphaproteobacteria bacterium]